MPTGVAAWAAADVPILCFDTCSILDIVRDPTRDTARDHEARAALQLVEAMEQRRLIGLVAAQVRLEFDANLSAVEAAAIAALAKLVQQLSRMDAFIGMFGAPGTTNVAHFNGHVARARAVVDRLMRSSKALRQPAAISARAATRLNLGNPPAGRGQNAKDCIVIETYLEAARRLRKANAAAPIVFVSSNTNDYADFRGAALKAGLVPDFAAVNMLYAPNLSAARFHLGV
jgi:hypothetical protein